MFYLLNIFLPSCVLLGSLLLILSATSWFVAWIALEVNLIAFLPIITTTNKLVTEAALKYFFVQVIGSIWVFFFILYSYFYASTTGITSSLVPFPALVLFALCLKLAVAPFHFWFPALIEGLNWPSTLILITLQKVGPLRLIVILAKHTNTLITLFSLRSVLAGRIRGLNQLICRKIMRYSSISHIGWLLYASLLSRSLLWLYFSLYAFITSTIILLFRSQRSFHINQVFFVHNTVISALFLFYLNFMSLGGLPPFLGFLPRWLVAKARKIDILIIILVLTRVVTLYFYLRITYVALIISSFKPLLTVVVFDFGHLKYLGLLPSIILPLLCLL